MIYATLYLQSRFSWRTLTQLQTRIWVSHLRGGFQIMIINMDSVEICAASFHYANSELRCRHFRSLSTLCLPLDPHWMIFSSRWNFCPAHWISYERTHENISPSDTIKFLRERSFLEENNIPPLSRVRTSQELSALKCSQAMFALRKEVTAIIYVEIRALRKQQILFIRWALIHIFLHRQNLFLRWEIINTLKTPKAFHESDRLLNNRIVI